MVEDDGPPRKRFKHESYSAALKNVHLPSAVNTARALDTDIPDNESHFQQSLLHWRQLCVTQNFLRFAGQVESLTTSLPLLLHNWETVVEKWTEAIDSADDESLKALLDLLQKFSLDLRATLLPAYESVLLKLLSLFPRTLSPETITTLLATLARWQRSILSSNPELILLTWKKLTSMMTKLNPELQRAVAEVWAATLRRFKAEDRGIWVHEMMANLEGVEDACAWVMVYACKSVSSTLHTTTGSLIALIIHAHITSSIPEKTFRLLRRVVTALIHHVQKAAQFQVVADVILDAFISVLSSSDETRIERMLGIARLPCAIRGGSRLTDESLTSLIRLFSTCPLAPAYHAACVEFLVAALTAGTLAVWAGPGHHALEHCFEDVESKLSSTLGLDLLGALAEAQWDGFASFGAPLLRKHTKRFMLRHPSRTARLLAEVQAHHRIVSETELQEWVSARLKAWSRTDGAVVLRDFLALCGNAISHELMELARIHTPTTVENAKIDFQEQTVNSGWVIGAVLTRLATIGVDANLNTAEISKWVLAVASVLAWHRHTMSGLAALASTLPPDLVEYDSLHALLRSSLASHLPSLRQSALEILSSPLVRKTALQNRILQTCVSVERIPLTVQGARERVLKTRKSIASISDAADAEIKTFTRWLLAQLKVNLRPVWKAAIEIALNLADQHSEPLWEVVFAELEHLCNSSRDNQDERPSWFTAWNQTRDNDAEAERIWRDPSASKLSAVTDYWVRNDPRIDFLVEDQRPEHSFDHVSYESQLISILEGMPSLVEKHNRQFVPLFLTFADKEDTPIAKVSPWMQVLAHFKNPAASVESERLRLIYIRYLSKPNAVLQRTAFSCILTFHLPAHKVIEPTITAVLDEKAWRDALTSLTSDFEAVSIGQRKEALQVLTQVLFGIMLDHRGKRRAAVLSSLGSACTEDELEPLIELMLQTISGNNKVSTKHQSGFLTLLGDVLKQLGTRTVPYWSRLLDATITILNNTQRLLNSSVDNDAREDADHVDDFIDERQNGDIPEREPDTKVLRALRQLGVRRLISFLRLPTDFAFEPFANRIFNAVVSPRVATLDRENTQAPSALLELIHTLALQSNKIHWLTELDGDLVPKTIDCLVAVNVKTPVIHCVFDILERLLTSSDERVMKALKPHISRLLDHMVQFFGPNPSRDSTTRLKAEVRVVEILSLLAPHIAEPAHANIFIDLLAPRLKQSNKHISEKTKVHLLVTYSHLLPLLRLSGDVDEQLTGKGAAMLSPLFYSLRTRAGRLALVAAFGQLCELDESLEATHKLLKDLNTYSAKRLDEPDFDVRLDAFSRLNEKEHITLSAQNWRPLLWNMLSFIQDPEETSIRNGSALAMCRFIDLVATSGGEYSPVFSQLLFPGLKRNLNAKIELVRADVLRVLAYAVKKCQHLASLNEMSALLADGDEEANFFNNILHIQIHRRTRALRRLSEQCESGTVRGRCLHEVFVPLVEQFISNATKLDHNLVTESISTVGRIAGQLPWGPYHSLVRKYLRTLKDKSVAERVSIRVLVAVLDGFHFSMESEANEEPPSDDEDEMPDTPKVGPIVNISSAKIEEAVNTRLLPALLNHLERRDRRDEAEDAIRIPISVGIVRIAMHLPRASRDPQVERLVTILSQILRSHSQETRDLTRETLYKIADLLGPERLGLMLREMRQALLRGPQLHVLAYVAHSLLVHVTSTDRESPMSDLDDAVADAAHVSAEVIFGESGKDVLSENFKTKMKEVRSSASKALDTFAILARYVSSGKLSTLLFPLKSIMHETVSMKVMQQADEVLRRIAVGLHSNERLTESDLLDLSYSLISQNSRFLDQTAPLAQKRDRKGLHKDYIVQMTRDATKPEEYFSHNAFRFIVFGLDLFSTSFKRGRFDLSNTDTITRMESLVSVIGNALYASDTSVVIHGLRTMSIMAKSPLKTLRKTLPIFVKQTLEILSSSGSIESEVAQAALRALATLIRDCPDAQLKSKDLDFLLTFMAPDLEETDRQGSVFAVLRAIVSRKFLSPEIYDMMDKVSRIMVTNQSPHVQEQCRAVLLQFLLDYPQGKTRLRTQMTFLASNLSYVHASGRISVMELLNAILSKFQIELLVEYADLFFVALVMVLGNDDTTRCREQAAKLVKSLLKKLDEGHRKTVLGHVHAWCTEGKRPQLTRVGFQVYGLAIDALQEDFQTHLQLCVRDIQHEMELSARYDEDGEEEEDGVSDGDWQSVYHAMIALAKAMKTVPSLALDSKQVRWSSPIALLGHPHAWVKSAAARAVGSHLAAFPISAPDAHPADLHEIAKRSAAQLKSAHLSDALATQVVKNLFYIGKCFCTKANTQDEESESNEGENEDDEDEATKNSRAIRLPWLFSSMSYTVRSAQIARRNTIKPAENWSQAPLAVMQWFAAMATYMETELLARFLVHILTPIYRIGEDDTVRDSQMAALKALAQEVQDLVQMKVGVTAFGNVWNKIRQGVLDVQRSRRTTRVLADPQRKMARNAAKKESKKRKTRAFMESRGALKRRREQ